MFKIALLGDTMRRESGRASSGIAVNLKLVQIDDCRWGHHMSPTGFWDVAVVAEALAARTANPAGSPLASIVREFQSAGLKARALV